MKIRNVEKDPTYVPPNMRTPPTAPRITRNTPQKEVTNVVTFFLYDEEHPLIGSQIGLGFSSKAGSVFGFEFVPAPGSGCKFAQLTWSILLL